MEESNKKTEKVTQLKASYFVTLHRVLLGRTNRERWGTVACTIHRERRNAYES
jgi:hypothetical protein